MDLPIIMVFIAVGLGAYLANELRRIERRLAGTDDVEHDHRIDHDVRKALEPYQRHLEKLIDERKQLPQTDLWAISSTPNWAEQLVKRAEGLRSLIEDIHGSSPDSYHISLQVAGVPMTYALSHALVTLANLRKDVGIKRTEWSIKKIEILGLARKRELQYANAAEAERDLQDIQQELAKLAIAKQNAEQELMRTFSEALRTVEGMFTS